MDIHNVLQRSRPRALRCARGLCAALVLAATSSCLVYPDSDERVDDDIVITTYAPDAEFDTYKTFAINPTINRFETKADGSVEQDTVESETSDKVIARITSKLEARGYQKVENTEEADLGITVTAISGLVIGSVSYWGGYYGWYWGYPGWGYYYPYDVYYAYEPGSMIVDMVDLKRAGAEYPRPPAGSTEPKPADDGEDNNPGPGGLAVVWAMAAYRAYVDDNTTGKLDQIYDAIDQAFVQSPYLKAE